MHSLHVSVVLALVIGGGARPISGSSTAAGTGPEVYLYGNEIKAPYKVELAGTAVLLNRVQVYPLLSDLTRPAIQPTQAQIAKHEFMAEGAELRRHLESAGKCCEEVTSALADHYRARKDLVADVWGLQENSFWVRWIDGSEEEIIVGAPGVSISAEDRARSELAQIQKALDSRCILIIGSVGSVAVPPDNPQRSAEVRAEIERARKTPIATFGTASKRYADGRWGGKYLPSDIARQFAKPLQLTPRQED